MENEIENEDDDFGDLYADVEAETISAINIAPQSSPSNTPSLCVTENLNNTSVLDDKQVTSSSSDDDDDDLDIVLNNVDGDSGEGFASFRNNAVLRNKEFEDEEDDTEEVIGIRNSHSAYKYLRSESAAYGSDIKGGGSSAAAGYLSWEDNGYYERMGSRLNGAQSGHRFSLPRARNILDVNVDIFENKPWKNPGVDISDYFNFGFNEDSWRLYCNQVDEYRHGGPMPSETPDSKAAQLTEGKGQAIEVEESIFERQSSMDIWRQMDLGSDVIQITITDPEEHLDGSVPETSNHGNDTGDDDGRDHLSFGSAMEDESVAGSHLEMDAPKRSSNRRSNGKPVRSAENHEIDHISDGSEGIDEAIKTSNDSKDTCTTETSIAESSEPEKSLASCLEGSRKLIYKKEYGENRYHARHTSPVYSTRNQGDSKHNYDSVIDDAYTRWQGDKRKYVDYGYHARRNSRVYNNSHKELIPKPDHKNDDICSRRPDGQRKLREYTYYAGDSSPIYNIKAHHEDDDHWKFGEHRYDARQSSPIFNVKAHHEDDDQRKYGEHRHHARYSSPVYSIKTHHEDDDYFPMSHNEGTYDMESSFDRHRWIKRLHAFDPYREENISFSKPELFSDLYGERFSDYEDWGTERFGEKMDQPVFRNSEEEDYYYEQRRYKEDNRIMSGDRCLDEMGAQWERREENLFNKSKGYNDDFFFEGEYFDDIQREQFGSLVFNDMERDEVEHDYEKHVAYTRWEFRGRGRSKGRDCSPLSEFNNSWLKKDEYVAHRSLLESYINNERWHDDMMPGNSLFRRHTKYRGHYSESYDTEDHMTDIDGHVNLGRTRHHWQSEMQWKEDENMLRHEDAKFYAVRGPVPPEKVSVHKRVAYDHVEESIDDPHEWLFMRGVDSRGSRVVDGLDYVEQLTDGPCANRFRYNQKKESFSGNKRLSQSYRSSLGSHLAGKGKSFGKHNKAGRVASGSSLNDKVALPVNIKAVDERLGIKNRQVPIKEVNMGPMKIDARAHVNDTKLLNQNEKTGFDDTRILEAMAKMEKRRVRFDEPAIKKDSDTVVDSVQVTASKKQHRPARKRKWGGN
uniref:FIP1[III]-like protein isoform X2 n=1 Tax=Erigeron canadensis TaxID=72917 RepID=UPI001CB943B8|nr:FIP1[III]-like protein isoform X2 [Erigeron canadensis]